MLCAVAVTIELDHEACLGHADGHRGLAHRRNGDADADGEDLGKGRVSLVLVDENESARVGQPLDAAHRLDAAERRQHHCERLRQFMRPAHRTVLGDLRHVDRIPLEAVDAGVAYPLDMVLAHRTLEQALGVADTIKPEVADVRL